MKALLDALLSQAIVVVWRDGATDDGTLVHDGPLYRVLDASDEELAAFTATAVIAVNDDVIFLS